MSVPTEVPVAPVPDGVMARRIWPILTASAVSLLPFTLLSVFLVDIAADSGESTAVIGSLRGLGGVAALVVGVLVVGVIDRFPRHRTSAVALVLLAASTLLATLGTATTLSLFCWGVGAAMAVLNPTLGALAGDHWDDPINSARAATLVSATQSSTALMAAPLVALPSLFWGWRGTLVAVTVIALGVALLLSRRPAPAVPAQTGGSRFRAYGTLLVRPLIAALVSISLIRTTVFMGWLAHVAAMYQQRFDLSAFWFSLVWTMSGGAFFLGNLLTGRMLARHSAPRAVAGVLVGGCLAGAVGLTLLLVPAPLPVAIAGTVVLAAGHASVAAAVTTLLVREAGTMRGTALALNAVAQSLGIFVGATAVGAALVAGGWAGVGLLLAVLTGVAAVLSLAVWGRSGR